MDIIINEYIFVYKKLEELQNQFSNCIAELRRIRESCEKDIIDIGIDYEEHKKSIETKIERTRAIIDIAKTHTTILNASTSAIPYDQGKLARLTVQINSNIKDDPFATELYYNATGQMISLQEEKDALLTLSISQKDNMASKMSTIEGKINRQMEELRNEVTRYLHGDEITSLVDRIEALNDVFSYGVMSDQILEKGALIIGFARMPLPICPGCEKLYEETLGQYFELSEKTLLIPLEIDVKMGNALIVEYTNESEDVILSGIQNAIVNYGRIFINKKPQVFFIDPVRFNSSALGELSSLCGESDALINQVPMDINGIKKFVNSIIANLNQVDLMDVQFNKENEIFLIFHDFPHGYDSALLSQIQQLFVNAKYYGLTIILTTNKSLQNQLGLNVIDYLKTNAILVTDNKYHNSKTNKVYNFKWLVFSGEIPAEIVNKYIKKRAIIDKSNIYEQRIGMDPITLFKKGNRHLKDIPFGIDSNGEIQTIDFENSNFATFICGASRSGKSTLLHTIITGIIKNTHPDDVEMWLIDFKMTEFSRYIENTPPHVRYIILDESPELVYDIINRLTEILQKRQNIFKGKWQKLDEVPSEKYMPAIIVIIDEFSVMSQIIADSIVNSKDNYSIKLQALLAKGAALGLHFIFASQGFTSGTRGLNDFSKKQIQQRIAMKTEFNEIKETLDLKSASDDDKAIMEQLPVYHTLTRIPVDSKGNHLKLSNVMYISDYTIQEAMIKSMWSAVEAAPKYDFKDNTKYIDKKTMIVDGNIYEAFDSKQNDISSFLENRRNYIEDDDSAFLFLGEPKRMTKLAPIEVSRGFCENILIIASNNEKMSTTSIVLSIEESLEMQNIKTEIWANKRNHIYKQYVSECKGKAKNIAKDLDSICKCISNIKKLIEEKVEANSYFILMGFESIIMDMEFYDSSLTEKKDIHEKNPLSLVNIEKRKSGELDLWGQLAAIEQGDYTQYSIEENEDDLILKTGDLSPSQIVNYSMYDAREDLKYIITNGPNFGYHFIFIFGSSGEVKQSKLDLSLFRHKILFRMSRQDAMTIIGASESSVISELDDRTFRYTNGIDSVSFRPYLHKGVYWDGWSVGDFGLVNSFEDEEEYLL